MQTADGTSDSEVFKATLDWTYTVHLETGLVYVTLQKQVTASRFMAVMKGQFGLSKPPPVTA